MRAAGWDRISRSVIDTHHSFPASVHPLSRSPVRFSPSLALSLFVQWES